MLIPIETLQRRSEEPGTISNQRVLRDEIVGVATDFISIVGPARHVELGDPGREVVWLFLAGTALATTREQPFAVARETIARSPAGWAWTIDVAADASVLALRIAKQLNDEDRRELDTAEYRKTNAGPYVRAFQECMAYSEAIKSAKTVSREILSQGIVPRMALGTVETTGPDQVGRHKHPMLEQLFLGLEGNDAVVTADDAKVAFPEHALLHIPLGSMHGTQVAAGKKLYYVWMDFFMTKADQAWLKMHKPLAE